MVQVDGESPVGPSVFSPTPWPVDEIIDEETMIDDPSKGRQVKTVVHYKKRFTRRNIGTEVYRSGTVTYSSTGNHSHSWTWGQYGQDISAGNVSVVYPMSEEALVRLTVDDFYSTNEVDSLLNIVEAPQLLTGLKTMYDDFFSIQSPTAYNAVEFGKKGARLVRKFGTLSAKQRIANLKKGISFLSGGYLYYSFGVAPVINDMRKLSSVTAKLSKRLKDNQKRAGTEVSVRKAVYGSFQQGLYPDGNGRIPDGYSSSQDNGSKWHTQIYDQSKPRMTCVVRGIRDRKFETSVFQKLDFLASRFGVTGPASFAWERIPFSFVVDWFVDMSVVLNTLDNALTGSSKQIKDVSLSQKWSALIPAIKHRHGPGTTSSNDGQQTALTEMSLYTRKPVEVNKIVDFSGRFGKKQAALSVALISQLGANLRLHR